MNKITCWFCWKMAEWQVLGEGQGEHLHSFQAVRNGGSLRAGKGLIPGADPTRPCRESWEDVENWHCVLYHQAACEPELAWPSGTTSSLNSKGEQPWPSEGAGSGNKRLAPGSQLVVPEQGFALRFFEAKTPILPILRSSFPHFFSPLRQEGK